MNSDEGWSIVGFLLIIIGFSVVVSRSKRRTSSKSHARRDNSPGDGGGDSAGDGMEAHDSSDGCGGDGGDGGGGGD